MDENTRHTIKIDREALRILRLLAGYQEKRQHEIIKNLLRKELENEERARATVWTHTENIIEVPVVTPAVSLAPQPKKPTTREKKGNRS